MSLFIAIRLWSNLWRSRFIQLHLRSDNIGALTVFSAVKSAPGGMNRVAVEYALSAAEGAYKPQVVEHLPGVANTIADMLSRRLDPEYSASWKVPSFLFCATRVTTGPRTRAWWRSLAVPGAP